MPALAHSPDRIVRQLLIDLGLGTAGGTPTAGAWPVFYDKEVTVPDSAITVFLTEAQDQGRIMFTGEHPQRHGTQVRVRSNTPGAAYAKMAAITTALDESVYDRTVVVDGTAYLVQSVGRLSAPIPAGPVSDRRSAYTLNLLATIVPVS